MELKKYQKQVIADLSHYMTLLQKTQNISKAYEVYWAEKGIPVGVNKDDILPYQEIISNVPDLCFKVPTGGGKTFLACHAIKTIFDRLPPEKMKVVVWLVPSDAILSQTIKALKDTSHPYRQQLDIDFGSKVAVYSKDELLNGQNFNIPTISAQLSVFVLSYDSFRGREGSKAKRENSNLMEFHKVLGKPEHSIKDADTTALLQIINQLSPLVIVDESHHARSKLSIEMLENFNPCFVLDLTATPLKKSNIISFVDAIQLKKENMVKLPVVVYNRHNQSDVIRDAIDARRNLERLAKEEQTKSGYYIRPIVLFQAQPKTTGNKTDYNKLKEKLKETGIPDSHIAIKTADINELNNINLMSPDCEIRYIITVNALKEGWDCPFAYILAALANKTSKVDVEQILGRILRQPYTHEFQNYALNMSYVLTSSNDFDNTLSSVVKSLQGIGFTEHDCRVAEDTMEKSPVLSGKQITGKDMLPQNVSEKQQNDFDFRPTEIKQQLESRRAQEQTLNFFGKAKKVQEQYKDDMDKNNDDIFSNVPEEVKGKMKLDIMKPEFQQEALSLTIPQFFHIVPKMLLEPSGKAFLTESALEETFSLRGKPYDIDFSMTDIEMAEVDITEGENNKPRAYKMNLSDQKYMREHLSSFPSEKQKKICEDIIYNQLNKSNILNSGELRHYLSDIIDGMDKDTLYAMKKAPLVFAQKIKHYIKDMLNKHAEKQFMQWLETGEIVCEPSYHLTKSIALLHSNDSYKGSLYDAEEEADGFEKKMMFELSGAENLKWWHRNIAASKKGFCINGFRNHYPDFIVMTKSGKILMIETKGDHLENHESRQRLKLGRAWQEKAGNQYRYYMVFESKDLGWNGAYPFSQFIKLLPNF